MNTLKFIALTDDIRVTSAVGTADSPFKGTFNGQAHTITADIDDTSAQGTAPFRYISGAVIKNLTVEGSVKGSAYAAGLVGFSINGTAGKPNTIENCIVNTAVSNELTGDNLHIGGVVGNGGSSYLKLKNTVFGGTMYNTDDYAGGLMGWCDSGCNLTIDNCLCSGTYTGTASGGFHPLAVCAQNASVTVNVRDFYYVAEPTLTDTSYIPVTTGKKVYGDEPFGYPCNSYSVAGVTVYEITGEPQPSVTINNASDWKLFAKSVSNDLTYAGVEINLNADITVTEMTEGIFKGTLNGKGHKITFNYDQYTKDGAALFHTIEKATIQFLMVDGVINISPKNACAIAVRSFGKCTINSCISRITVNSTVDGDGTHSGFVCINQEKSVLNFNNSVFDGTINGEKTTRCAGFVGWNNGTVNIKNSLMGGKLNIKVQGDETATFCRNYSVTLTNSYYRKKYGLDVQGTAVGNKTDEALVQALGRYWTISDDKVVPKLNAFSQLEFATVSGINAKYLFTNDVIDINPVVTSADGIVLKKDVDYTIKITWCGISADEVKYSGNYVFTFVPAANSSYTGTISSEFIVQLIDLSDVIVSGISESYDYTGNDISITPVLETTDGTKLIDGINYTTMLVKNARVISTINEAGSYTYTFTGDPEHGCDGDKKVTFEVRPKMPTNFKHKAYGSDTAALAWNEVEYATSYEVQYSKDSTFQNGSSIAAFSTNTGTLTGLDKEAKYYARVRALTNNYPGPWSDTVLVETTSKRWVGFGSTSVDTPLPFQNYHRYSFTEQIYKAQELGTAGLITSIDLMKIREASCERNIDIYMVHTDKEYFPEVPYANDVVAVTEADKVFSGTVNFAYNEWTTITFDKRFNYNGTQNVVLVIDDNTGTDGKSTNFRSFSSNITYSLYDFGGDDINPDDVYNIDFSPMKAKNAVRFGVETGHTISIDQNIQNGTVSTPITVKCKDKKVTVNVEASEGYYCEGVSVNGGAVEVTQNADGTYSFIMPDADVTVNAEFDRKKTEVIINCVDINGISTPTTVYAETYTNSEYPVPDAPYLDGYTFSGWKVNDGETLSASEDVQTAVYDLVKAGTAVTVAVVYTKKNDTHTVAFTADSIGCTIKDADGKGIASGTEINVSEQLYAVADKAAPGQKFSHWLRIQGDKQTIVGYETTYAFRMPHENMTLSAVYVNEETQVDKKGTAYIESVTVRDINSISFVSISSVPNGAKMQRAGIVACKESDLINGHTAPTIDYARFKKYDDTACPDYTTFKYTWTKSNAAQGDVWCVCAYLQYTDENGNEQTVYGNMVKASLDGIVY